MQLHDTKDKVNVAAFSTACERKRRMEKPRKKFTGFIDDAVAAANKMDRDELLFSYKGILYPVTLCSPEVFRAMESLEARSDDIILAAYPKSGTNWLAQILNDLVAIFEKKTQNKESSGNDEELEEFPYLEIGDTGKYERMNKLPSRRIMITHLLPENLPRSVFKNKAKILLLIRNPKDLVTSFYHFTNGIATLPSYETWDDFFVAFMTKKMPWGCYFEYLSKWNKYAADENVMPMTYEELKENPVLGVKSIAAFFGISLTEEELQTVVERSSFQSMKKNSEKTHGAYANVFFRKGAISDWKNLFSEDQNEKMDKAFEEHIRGTKLGTMLKYDVYCKA
ncbi:sulfotransferase 6B1-like isoform X2 [Apus apus]|uniref:sulfotransferase 6B1-like isoform X2 n=1 Tax=Apus apus TaxID=8895 RepID=UPI0021F91069|nr:sulfotransferase 6B1-like isoform X2 [Apus apus]